MKYFHSVHVCVFIKSDEDKKAINDAFISLFPFSLEEEKLTFSETSSTGITGNTIIILELSLTKERLVKAFFSHLLSSLSTEQKTLLCSQENRIDDNCQFFIRLDKDALLSKKYVFTDSGSCFHLRFSVAAFPKKQSVALALVKEVISKDL